MRSLPGVACTFPTCAVASASYTGSLHLSRTFHMQARGMIARQVSAGLRRCRPWAAPSCRTCHAQPAAHQKLSDAVIQHISSENPGAAVKVLRYLLIAAPKLPGSFARLLASKLQQHVTDGSVSAGMECALVLETENPESAAIVAQAAVDLAVRQRSWAELLAHVARWVDNEPAAATVATHAVRACSAGSASSVRAACQLLAQCAVKHQQLMVQVADAAAALSQRPEHSPMLSVATLLNALAQCGGTPALRDAVLHPGMAPVLAGAAVQQALCLDAGPNAVTGSALPHLVGALQLALQQPARGRAGAASAGAAVAALRGLQAAQVELAHLAPAQQHVQAHLQTLKLALPSDLSSLLRDTAVISSLLHAAALMLPQGDAQAAARRQRVLQAVLEPVATQLSAVSNPQAATQRLLSQLEDTALGVPQHMHGAMVHTLMALGEQPSLPSEALPALAVHAAALAARTGQVQQLQHTARVAAEQLLPVQASAASIVTTAVAIQWRLCAAALVSGQEGMAALPPVQAVELLRSLTPGLHSIRDALGAEESAAVRAAEDLLPASAAVVTHAGALAALLLGLQGRAAQAGHSTEARPVSVKQLVRLSSVPSAGLHPGFSARDLEVALWAGAAVGRVRPLLQLLAGVIAAPDSPELQLRGASSQAWSDAVLRCAAAGHAVSMLELWLVGPPEQYQLHRGLPPAALHAAVQQLVVASGPAGVDALVSAARRAAGWDPALGPPAVAAAIRSLAAHGERGDSVHAQAAQVLQSLGKLLGSSAPALAAAAAGGSAGTGSTQARAQAALQAAGARCVPRAEHAQPTGSVHARRRHASVRLSEELVAQVDQELASARLPHLAFCRQAQAASRSALPELYSAVELADDALTASQLRQQMTDSAESSGVRRAWASHALLQAAVVEAERAAMVASGPVAPSAEDATSAALTLAAALARSSTCQQAPAIASGSHPLPAAAASAFPLLEASMPMLAAKLRGDWAPSADAALAAGSDALAQSASQLLPRGADIASEAETSLYKEASAAVARAVSRAFVAAGMSEFWAAHVLPAVARLQAHGQTKPASGTHPVDTAQPVESSWAAAPDAAQAPDDQLEECEASTDEDTMQHLSQLHDQLQAALAVPAVVSSSSPRGGTAEAKLARAWQVLRSSSAQYLSDSSGLAAVAQTDAAAKALDRCLDELVRAPWGAGPMPSLALAVPRSARPAAGVAASLPPVVAIPGVGTARNPRVRGWWLSWQRLAAKPSQQYEQLQERAALDVLVQSLQQLAGSPAAVAAWPRWQRQQLDEHIQILQQHVSGTHGSSGGRAVVSSSTVASADILAQRQAALLQRFPAAHANGKAASALHSAGGVAHAGLQRGAPGSARLASRAGGAVRPPPPPPPPPGAVSWSK